MQLIRTKTEMLDNESVAGESSGALEDIEEVCSSLRDEMISNAS